MRVKVGQLKTHFSKYLRRLKESREPIEVCLRDQPVAYLVPYDADDRGAGDARLLQQRLAAVGLSLADAAGVVLSPAAFTPAPAPPGDGRQGVDTVREMRESKDS